MAYTAVIVTVAEMQFMAGENRDATGDVEANHTALQDQAEGYLSALIQEDVATNFSGYDTTTKEIITEWAARYAGMQLILFNTSGYTNGLSEVEDMVDVHIYRMEKIEELLKKGAVLKQIGVA